MKEAKLILFEYIEIYYNRRRRYSSNSWLSPANFKKVNLIQKAA